MNILRKPNKLPTQDLRQQVIKHCGWEIMFVVWTVYASLSKIAPNSLFPLLFNCDVRGAHRFARTTTIALCMMRIHFPPLLIKIQVITLL